ncbi:MAG: hypothetical protein HYS07_09025 [Chlamydiae bacterium]|nr:hypothetical protein [Chlamydiota bacterium]MBI3276980.1 hypothetical protein [Chlamydiota bacterium]
MNCKTKSVLAITCLVGFSVASSFGNSIHVQDLVDHPERFTQDQTIEIQCYFSRESTAWLHLISHPSKYTGFFVFEKKDSLILDEKVLFPYVFVPKSLNHKMRRFRSGDFVLIKGKCFKHQAVGKEAVGIVADHILILDENGVPEAIELEEPEAWPGRFNPPKKARSMEPSGSALAVDSNLEETYTIQIGANTLSGLHWGQKYSLNEVEFIVTKDDK